MAKETELNGYELSRAWFDFCFANPELVNPAHTAIFCFAIEHCNRLGWKVKFGFPTQMSMDAIGIKKHQTYIKYFNDLCEWGFFKLVQKSLNQYSSNIICLQYGNTKNGKALDKAFITHAAKQTEPNGQSNGQSKGSIDKQETNKQYNNKQYYREFAHLKLSHFDFNKLVSSGYTTEEIDNILDKIENYKNNTRYTSLYLTANAWLKKEIKEPVKSKIEKGINDIEKGKQQIKNMVNATR